MFQLIKDALGKLWNDGGAESQRIARIINRDVTTFGKGELQDLLSLGQQIKPPGYDDEQKTIALLYSNRQYAVTKAVMIERYKNSHARRPVYVLPTIRQSANLDAQAYRQLPDRSVEMKTEDGWVRPGMLGPEDETGETVLLPDDVFRQDGLRDVLESVRIDVLMPEWERRTMASVDHFARIVTIDGVLEWRLFWPNVVWAIPDEKAPGKIGRAQVVMAMLDAGSATERYEIWVRRDDEKGNTVGWSGTHMLASGERTHVFDWNDPESGWFSLHRGDPQGTLWHEPDYDAARVNIEHNIRLSSWHYREDYQAHKQILASGAAARDMAGQEKFAGPGDVMVMPPETEITVVDSDHDMTTLEGAELLLKMQGNANRQNPDSWMSEPGPPLSGVSRDIRNVQSDAKREEMIALFRHWEQQQFLPRLVRIAEAGGVIKRKISGPAVRYRANFPPAPRYEDAETRRMRYDNGMRSSLVSPAMAAHKGFPDLYPTLQDAIAFGLSNKLLPMQAEAPKSRARIPGSEAPPVQQEGVAEVGGRRFGQGVEGDGAEEYGSVREDAA